MIPIEFFLYFAAILFVIGLYGIITTRKSIVSLMCIELMLNAANINLVAFSAYGTFSGVGNTTGEVFVIMTIAVAAAEVAVGIALILNAYKMKGTTDVDELTSMRW
jgi:NADH:ubiquinone oxidoreductase subunit K